MKYLRSLLCVLAASFFALMHCGAQGLAPNSLADELLAVTITGGTTPFASSGTYKLFTSAVATNYTLLGDAGAGIASGTYGYSQTATNAGVMELTDAQGGPTISVQLTFTSNNVGSVALANGSGAQTGTFTATNYATITVPNLFLSSLINGRFNAFLSGQAGFNYAIQSSTNATTWTAWANLLIGDLTTNFSAAIEAGQASLYRAQIAATPFAPVAVAGQTFNITIANGALPLATNGICQFMATNGAGFQILGGPGLENSAGDYTYTRTGDAGGVITYTNSTTSASNNVKLVFTSPKSGHFYWTGGGGFEAGTFSMTHGPVVFLGNMKFAVDSTRGTSQLFPANGKPVTLIVTNAAGYIWQLSLPGDALPTPRFISMTPFASIDSSQAWLPVAAGVQLEPDGIQFSDAVTLTVTPPAPLGSNASLVMAQDDGSGLYFVAQTNRDNVYSTTLAHFTSGGMGNPSGQQQNAFANQYSASAQAAYTVALADVQALESSLETPPEPPDYDLSCDSDGSAADDSLTDLYVSGLFAQDTAAIQRLTSAAQTLFALTGDPSVLVTSQTQPRLLVESAEFFEVSELFATYGTDPKKFIPLLRAAQAVELQDLLYGGNEHDHFTDQIQAAGQSALNSYFEKLTGDDDYSVITALTEIEQQLDMIGGGDDATFDQMLEDALTFDLMVDITLTSSDGGEEAKGDITLTAASDNFPCAGSGTMNYTSGNLGPATLEPGQSFSISAAIDNVDACNGMTISIIINQFSADQDTFTDMGHDISVPSPLGEAATVVFDSNKQSTGAYAGEYLFSASLQNQSAEAANQTFTGQGEGGSVTVNFVLTHTPQ